MKANITWEISKSLSLLALVCNTYAADQITVSGLSDNKAIVTIDGKLQVLEIGKRNDEGVMLISTSSKEAVIEINGRQKTYTIGTHVGNRTTQPSSHNKATWIAPDNNGMYGVDGSINGFQVKFLVDTGATLVAMSRRHAKRLGIDYKLEGKESVSQTASGIAKTYLINLKSVRVGDIELNNVQGSVIDGDFPTIILLGNSFLGKLNIKKQDKMLILEKKPY